jgi:Glycosyltransferase like family
VPQRNAPGKCERGSRLRGRLAGGILRRMNLNFRFVCATRVSAADFPSKTALGQSLAPYLRSPSVELRLFPENRQGLPRLYNQAIREAASRPAVLIFLHDDIHLCDFFWAMHVAAGLRSFDVIGLAGNKRRVPRQPSWYFIDERFTPEAAQNTSGIVGHGSGFPPVDVTWYGMPGQQVKLLDGLFLAVHSQTLLARQLEFDERFDFHFYDMDFCRQAEARNLRLGTWTISVIHESGGNFDTPDWRSGYARYLEKWQS